jgi:hypothetical protein
MSAVQIAIAITLAAGFLLLLLALQKTRSARETPPGPERNFLGYTLDFPRDHFYETFTKWNRQFGASCVPFLPPLHELTLAS